MSRKLLRVGLIPTPHDDRVRQRLEDAAAVAGWRVADAPPSGRIRKPTLVLTPWTPWMTQPSQLLADVILSPDPAGSVQWVEDQGLGERPHSVAIATDWLATAAAMPEATRVVGPIQLGQGSLLAEGLLLPPLDVSASHPDTPVQVALEFYGEGRPHVGITADWPVALMDGPLGGNNNDRWTSIVGPARTLAFGPFICLSPGQWRLRLTFDMDAEAAQLGWSFDWGSGDSYVSLTARPGRSGRFEAVLDRAWTGSAPAQARMVLTESALGGRARLASVTVERIG